jgi:hypothetical protein
MLPASSPIDGELEVTARPNRPRTARLVVVCRMKVMTLVAA